MDTLDREIWLLDTYSARQAAVLIRLATGKSISRTARELKMSRSTIYQLMKSPGFKLALLKELRHFVAVGLIEDRCLAYRRKILKCVIRTFSKLEGGESRLSKFEKYLDKIDAQSEMERMP